MKSKPSEWLSQPVKQQRWSQSWCVSSEAHSASLDGSSPEQESPPEPSEKARSRMLREVAQITAQSFQSSQEAMRAALKVIGDFLDCQSLFVARFGSYESETTGTTDGERSTQCTLKIMETRNAGMPSPIAGSEGPLDRTYCATVIRTQQPLIVEDVRRYPFYQQLATTEEYNIGSYIGVPLIYSDGRVYGTLCSQDPNPRPLSAQPEKLELMQIVARFLISYIEREELTTHLRQAQEAQQELNERFNEFLSIASHELRGPLTALSGNVQFAQRTLRTLLSQCTQESEAWPGMLEKLQRYLERAESQIHVQTRLTSDLIDVSRIRAGKLALHKQPCDLGQIVRQVVEDQCQVTEDRIITLELPEEEMNISGDADRLGQVVSNYLTNALKYSSPDQPVGVAVTTDGREVRVTVSDRGTGLTPEQQQHVWERFYRAKGVQVLSGHGIGLGLGLHICKTIIEQHGGSVGLDSLPGEGSRFWFTLSLNSVEKPCK